jgi:hypothetical protein
MNFEFWWDEHEFVAPGKLLASSGYLPYRDYAFTHMPYLVFIYGLVFKFSSYLLLSARLVSVISGFLTLIALFFFILKLFYKLNLGVRLLIATGFLSVLLNNPLFTEAYHLAWNHAPPVLFIVLASMAFCQGAHSVASRKYVFISGFLAGISIGIRLSLAPTLLPFLIMILFYPQAQSGKEKGKLIGLFCSGVFLALLPAMLLFVSYPNQFMFSNFGYQELSRRYFPYHETAFFNKLTTVKNIFGNPCNLMLIFMFCFFMIKVILEKKAKFFKMVEIVFILILLPFLLIGAFAPPRMHSHYMYGVIPFLLLIIGYGVKDSLERGKQRNVTVILLALFVIFSNCYGEFSPSGIKKKMQQLSPQLWVTIRAHNLGQEIGKIVGAGKVLTLAPIFPLEGGKEIYKEFAAGQYIWRISPLLKAERRKEQGVYSAAELSELLDNDPPKGILVGFDGNFLERPLMKYAVERGYQAVWLSKGTLWVAPDQPFLLICGENVREQGNLEKF